jgi:DnaJ-class molecular chaperone
MAMARSSANVVIPVQAKEGLLQDDLITLNIPGGVAEGMQLSMSGKGNVPARGGVAGDLLIVIEEEEDALLKRDGNNVSIRYAPELYRCCIGNFG